MQSLSHYSDIINQFASSNQTTAKKLLENPQSEDKQDIALNHFFGSKYLLNYGGEESAQEFKSSLAKVGGSELECITPKIPSEEEYQIIFRNYKNYNLQDTTQAEKWKEQRKKEIVPVITFLDLLKRVKAKLIEACENYTRSIENQDEKTAINEGRSIRALSQPLFFQDNARFGILAPDRMQFSLKDLAPIFHKAISQLPSWDLFYLEAWAKETPPEEKNLDGLVRVGRSLHCSAFVLNYTLMEELESQLEASLKESCGPLDNIIGPLARTHHFYAINPSCIFRTGGKTYEQSQPICSPINIQREAVNFAKNLTEVEVNQKPEWDWKKFFGDVHVVSVDALPKIIETTLKNWEEANLNYRQAQDNLFSKKSIDESDYKESEKLRRQASSILIVFGDQSLPIGNDESAIACCEALSNLPKDWQIISFKGQKQTLCSSLQVNDLANVNALAINYLAYKNVLLALEKEGY